MNIRRLASVVGATALTTVLGTQFGLASASAGETDAAAAPDEGMLVLVIVGGTLGFILLSFVFAFWLKRRIFRGSKKKRALAKRLVETGQKARAMVIGLEPTGLVMNEINIQCRLRFRLDPLDGSPAFEGEKKAYVNQTRMPRIGEVWPCWYDAADRSTFAVGQPNLGDPASVAVLAEFGLPHPLASSGSFFPMRDSTAG